MPTSSESSVAEWSKALVSGTSHFDGVGSNPTAAKVPFFARTMERGRRIYFLQRRIERKECRLCQLNAW